MCMRNDGRSWRASTGSRYVDRMADMALHGHFIPRSGGDIQRSSITWLPLFDLRAVRLVCYMRAN